MENTYIPRYHLYPTNPQILHHLVLELFVRAPQYEKEDESFFAMMPSGPIYKYGWVLADQWKQVFQSHPTYKTLVLIAWVDLPPDVAWLITSDEYLHTFFWTIKIDNANYASWFMNSPEMFAMYAKPVEAQLPFIRAYKHYDNVVPYIINMNKDQVVIDDMLDTIISQYWTDACVVFIQPEKWVEKLMEYVGNASH